MAVCLSLQGCKDMHSIYNEFTVPGGTKYPAKVQSLVAHSGKKRVLLRWPRSVDPAVEKVRVFWNNYRDSLDVDLKGSELDTISQWIQPLEEGTYEFILYSLDADQKRSVAAIKQGRSYGDDYRSYLNNSVIETDELASNQGLSITWGTPDYLNGMIGTNLFYKDRDGKDKSIFLPSEEKYSLVTDIDPNTEHYSYQAVFLPDTLAVDTFMVAIDSRIPNIKLNTSQWTATARSTQDNINVAAKTIDGDLQTYWHSKHTPTPIDPYPHWLAYDMKQKMEVSRIVLHSRPDRFHTEDFNRFTIQSSDDGLVWKDHGSFTHGETINGQNYTPTSPFRGRYLRIYMTAGTKVYNHMAELVVFGRILDN